MIHGTNPNCIITIYYIHEFFRTIFILGIVAAISQVIVCYIVERHKNKLQFLGTRDTKEADSNPPANRKSSLHSPRDKIGWIEVFASQLRSEMLSAGGQKDAFLAMSGAVNPVTLYESE